MSCTICCRVATVGVNWPVAYSTPDLIVVKAEQPVRLRFTHRESSACSEMVLFPDFNRSAKLPEGEEVAVEFTTDKSGEYGFQCQMGMLRGKLIVE
ncbi:hypothetical protein ANAEL_03541 [Anaerolineales bacterium]|nr:hypothetical protein ANAEL_03541 [Anaerolineales bacterium]